MLINTKVRRILCISSYIEILCYKKKRQQFKGTIAITKAEWFKGAFCF